MFNITDVVGKRSDLDEVKTTFEITQTAAKSRVFKRMIQRAIDLDPERNDLNFIMSKIADQLADSFEEQEEKERVAAERKREAEEKARADAAAKAGTTQMPGRDKGNQRAA